MSDQPNEILEAAAAAKAQHSPGQPMAVNPTPQQLQPWRIPIALAHRCSGQALQPKLPGQGPVATAHTRLRQADLGRAGGGAARELQNIHQLQIPQHLGDAIRLLRQVRQRLTQS